MGSEMCIRDRNYPLTQLVQHASTDKLGQSRPRGTINTLSREYTNFVITTYAIQHGDCYNCLGQANPNLNLPGIPKYIAKMDYITDYVVTLNIGSTVTLPSWTTFGYRSHVTERRYCQVIPTNLGVYVSTRPILYRFCLLYTSDAADE